MNNRPAEIIHIDYNLAITEARREQGRTVRAGWRWIKDHLHGEPQSNQAESHLDEHPRYKAKAP